MEFHINIIMLVQRHIHVDVISFPRLSGTGMTSLTMISTAEILDDCVFKFGASLVRTSDQFLPNRTPW